MRLPELFKAGETLKSDIGPKLNTLVHFVRSLVPHGDSRTIMVRHTDNGTFFSANARGGGPGGGKADEYTGAFAVSQKEGSDTVVTVKAGNVIEGIEKTSVPETDVTISATSYLYLKLTYDGSYVAKLKAEAEMPDLSADYWTKEIAHIEFEDAKIKSITQLWKSGDMEVTGRLT